MSIFQNQSWQHGMTRFADEANSQFGEQLAIIPMKRVVNKDAIRDPNRSIIPAIQGQFHYRYLEPWIGGGSGQRNDTKPLPVQSRDPMVTFPRERLPYAIVGGDIIRRCDGTEFQVITAEPDGVSQISFKLLQLGVQSQFA